MNKLRALMAMAGMAAMSQSALADVSYDTSGSSFACGSALNCTASGNLVTFSSGANVEKITFTPDFSTVGSGSNISYGYLSLSSAGTTFSLTGLQFLLNVSDNGGPSTLLSTGLFTAPFGSNDFPEVTFSPTSGVIGGDTYHLAQGFNGATGVYLFSANSAAQVAGSVTAAAVPEPSTWAMALLGVLGLGFMARRRATESNPIRLHLACG